MLGPHILGSRLVISFIIARILKASARCCSSATLLRKSSTLASVFFVFCSAMIVILVTDLIRPMNEAHFRLYAERGGCHQERGTSNGEGKEGMGGKHSGGCRAKLG